MWKYFKTAAWTIYVVGYCWLAWFYWGGWWRIVPCLAFVLVTSGAALRVRVWYWKAQYADALERRLAAERRFYDELAGAVEDLLARGNF